MVVHKSATSFQKPQTITVNLEQQLVSTNNSSQKVDLSSSTTASKREIGGNHMKNDPIHWRRTKYGRNRQNNNKNKLLYALIQLHNHYVNILISK